MARKRRISADDIFRIKTLSGAEISPDGKHVVFSVNRIDKKTLKQYANLWIAGTDGKTLRQFTWGDQVDGSPKWSPKGDRIAFISNRKDEKQPQIFIIPFSGGEARPVTDMKGSFSGISWSPDSRYILCSFSKKDAEELERQNDEKKKKLGQVYRHVKRVFHKFDGKGYLPEERQHIWKISVRTGKATQLTEGEVHDEWSPEYSPDGKEIVYLSNISKDPDMDPEAVDIFIKDLKTGKTKKIPAPEGDKELPSYSPCGGYIAYIGRKGKYQWWRNSNIFTVPVKGKGRARNLTGKHDFTVCSWTINDIVGLPSMSKPVWSKDGTRILFQVSEAGNTVLRTVEINTGRVSDIISGETVVGSVSVDRDFTRMSYFKFGMKDPGELYAMDLDSGRERRLSDLNAKALKDIDLGTVEEHWIKGPSGDRLHGWILKPPGFSKKRKYPSILEIHGGPQVQYGNIFMLEFYYLAAKGYVVYFCNPRGSIGYGEKHGKGIWNNWGTVDYDDIMAWTDFVSRKSYIDKKRMGITGGSYGGYMTNWVIGKTRRFAAAVTQRCVSNLISMWGTSDGNWYFEVEFGGKPPWKSLDNYWRQSPLSIVENVKTPTLIIHSEFDYRCPIEQAEQMFVALKRLNIDTEMIIFREESHGLSRGGRADRRIERLKHISGWFDRYLKKK